MALKFRLRGLAETFLDEITCTCCGSRGNDEDFFSTELTRVTFEGIIVVVQCRACGEIFVPKTQRLGIINPGQLKEAVEQDCKDSGEPLFESYVAVRLNAEKLNALRKGAMH
jgi:hypothetical protein